MSADIESWPPPDDPAAFESLCLDLWPQRGQRPAAGGAGGCRGGGGGLVGALVIYFGWAGELMG